MGSYVFFRLDEFGVVDGVYLIEAESRPVAVGKLIAVGALPDKTNVVDFLALLDSPRNSVVFGKQVVLASPVRIL